MSLEDLYMEIILDHYRNARNRSSELPDHDVHVHHSNPLCGDELDLRVRVRDESIDGIAFDGDGCSISIASASVRSEVVKQRGLDDAEDLVEAFRRMMHGEGVFREEDLGDGAVFEGVAKFPVRVKCALLGWMALKDALTTHKEGRVQHSVTHD